MLDDPSFYKEILESLYDGVYFVDLDRRITYWNKGAEAISGYSAQDVMGKHCRDKILNHVTANGVELCTEHCPLAATMLDGQRREAEVFLHHANGHRVPVLVRAAPIYDADGQIMGAVEMFSDNTSQLLTRRKNEQLQQTVLLDALTGVGNRRHVETHMKAEMLISRESGNPFGLLFVDIDYFKRVNDSYGHDVGDKVLCMVANTLRHNLRVTDTIGRWGGEEFVILLSDINRSGLESVSSKLHYLVAQSRLDVEQQSLNVTISIGATLVQADDSIESLIQRADRLMYESKNAGRNCVTIG